MDILSFLRQERAAARRRREKFEFDRLMADTLPWDDLVGVFFLLGAAAGVLACRDVAGWGDWSGSVGALAGALHGAACAGILRVISMVFPAPFAWISRFL
ncbi:MAG: hypothetical protein IJS87_08575 [Rhodocyclaceae bacterium]|nr:hypothetical protein [Rhodocyclaceae bacterium]